MGKPSDMRPAKAGEDGITCRECGKKFMPVNPANRPWMEKERTCGECVKKAFGSFFSNSSPHFENGRARAEREIRERMENAQTVVFHDPKGRAEITTDGSRFFVRSKFVRGDGIYGVFTSLDAAKRGLKELTDKVG